MDADMGESGLKTGKTLEELGILRNPPEQSTSPLQVEKTIKGFPLHQYWELEKTFSARLVIHETRRQGKKSPLLALFNWQF